MGLFVNLVQCILFNIVDKQFFLKRGWSGEKINEKVILINQRICIESLRKVGNSEFGQIWLDLEYSLKKELRGFIDGLLYLRMLVKNFENFYNFFIFL